MGEKLRRVCHTWAQLGLPLQFSEHRLGLFLIKDKLRWPFSSFHPKDTVVGLKAWIFYSMTILSVKAEGQLSIRRTGSTQETRGAKCFGALTDTRSFMGRFERSEILPCVFERQAKGESNVFTLFSLFAFLTYTALPQRTLSAVGWQLKSTSGVLCS